MIDLLAYIDPGSTAVVLQILAGVFISLGVVFGIWRTKIITFFKTLWVKMFKKNKKDGDTDENNEDTQALKNISIEDEEL